ncbi:MAG: methyltransferase [Chthoniobacteraceae bacterium]
MMTIARFNWPFYLAAIVVLIGAMGLLLVLPGTTLKILAGAGVAGAAYFIVGSLGVSHLIYDRSDLYRWRWLERALRGANRERFILCHSGFDECSEVLREMFAATDWQVLDHFDAAQMTEASIRRARRIFPPTPDTLPAPHDRWPGSAVGADVVFGLLAIHEFRSDEERRAWFSEAKRSLHADGRVVIVEHLRDLANFLVFGPGVLHFHSRGSWRRSWERAGLRCIDEFSITPWIRVFVLVAT